VPIAGLSLIPVFFRDWPLILLPVHILFLELIIDPSCTLIFEAEEAEPNAMSRPPRSPSERLFGPKSLAASLLQGFGALAAVLGVFLAARALGYGADGARGLTFTALVAANLSLILTNQSWSRTALVRANSSPMPGLPEIIFYTERGGLNGLCLLLPITLYLGVEPFVRQAVGMDNGFKPGQLFRMEFFIAKGQTQGVTQEAFCNRGIGENNRLGREMSIVQQIINRGFAEPLLEVEYLPKPKHELTLARIDDPISTREQEQSLVIEAPVKQGHSHRKPSWRCNPAAGRQAIPLPARGWPSAFLIQTSSPAARLPK